MKIKSNMINTNRGRMEYTLLGNGPVVLHIHGMSSSCQAGSNYNFLVDAGYSVLTPSRPGYGKTPVSVGKSAKDSADAIISMLDALKIEKAYVLAVSGGGPTGIYLAANYPDRIQKFILEAAISYTSSEEYRKDSIQKQAFYGSLHILYWRMLRIMSWISTKKTALQTFSLFSFHDPEDIKTSFTKKDYQFVRHFYGRKSSAIGGRLDLSHTVEKAILDQITMPTLILHSPEDKSVRFYHAAYSHENIKTSELYNAKSISHFTFWGPEADDSKKKMLDFFNYRFSDKELLIRE